MVTAYKLDALGNHVDLEVFVDAPYDKFVDASTRFWNESGIDISVGADGGWSARSQLRRFWRVAWLSEVSVAIVIRFRQAGVQTVRVSFGGCA